MPQAYFKVPRGSTAVDAALESGVIAPPAMRLHPSVMSEICTELWERLGRAASDKVISNETVGTVLMVIESRLAEIEKAGDPSGPKEPFTNHFGCWDIVSGDVWRVVLSIGGWRVQDFPDTGNNGFVFDADSLIDTGAYYRTETFYDEVIERFMKHGKRKLSVEDWARTIKSIAEESTLRGADAKSYIRDYPRSHHGWPARGDLVWDGPLPIVLALESWRDGERMSAGQVVGDEMKEFLHGVIQGNEAATLEDAETELAETPEDAYGIPDKEPYENELSELIGRFGRHYELIKLVGPPTTS